MKRIREEQATPIVVMINGRPVVDELMYAATRRTKRMHSQIPKLLSYDFKINDKTIQLKDIPAEPILECCNINYMQGYNKWDRAYTNNLYINAKDYNKFWEKADLYIQIKYAERIYKLQDTNKTEVTLGEIYAEQN